MKDQKLFTKYVPLHVREIYSCDEKKFHVPFLQEKVGMVAILDLKGYSALTTKLAKIGEFGLEILTRVLNKFFDKLINKINSCGGDIIKFAGDAIIACWKSEQSYSAEIMSKNAILCLLELLQELGNYSIHISEIGLTQVLTIHIGLGYGEIYDVHIGNIHDRCEYFIAGNAVYDAARILNLAKINEIAISKNAWSMLVGTLEHIVNYCSLETCVVLSGFKLAQRPSYRRVSIKPTDPVNDAYKKYINASALYRLSSTYTELINELREVTVVFIRIGAVALLDVPTKLSRAQIAFESIQRCLKKYEGVMHQFFVDDKGTVVLSIFGLPPGSHENNAIFGTKAAMCLKINFSGLFEDFSIAVASGKVFVGTIGNNTRCDFCVVGDAVNIAAGLMSTPQAKRDILCDKATCENSKEVYPFSYLEDFSIKGKPTPIAVYRPLNVTCPGSDIGNNIGFIGRAHELEQIRTVFTTFMYGKPTTLIIEGEPGDGKSKFARKISTEAQSIGMIVCISKAIEVEKKSPYYIYRDIFLQLFEAIEKTVINDSELIEDGRSVLEPSSDGTEFGFSMIDQEQHLETSVKERVETEMAKKNTNDQVTLGQESINSLNPEIIMHMRSLKRRNSLPIGGGGNNLADYDEHLSLIDDSLFQSSNHSKDNFSQSESIDQLNEPKHTPLYENASMVDTNAGTATQLSENEQSVSHSSGDLNDTPQHRLTNRIISCLRKLKIDTGLAPLLDMILPIDFPENNLTRRLSGKVKGRRLNFLLINILNKIGSCKPVMIILDDCHWQDSASWLFTEDILSVCPKVLLCFLTIQDANSFIMNRIKLLPTARLISLQGLSKGETKQLMISLCGPYAESVPEALVDMIHKKTGGNPLFIENLIEVLMSSHALKVDLGSVILAEGSLPYQSLINSIPENQISLIISNFDRLSPELQVILRTASAMGQFFCMEDLYNAMGVKVDLKIFKQRLNRLVRCGFLLCGKEDDGTNYNFKNEMHRQSIYSLLLSEQRNAIHCNLAKYYEKKLVDEHFDKHAEAKLLPLISYHYGQTEDIAKKTHYLEMVGNFFVEHACYSEAIEVLSNLLQTYKTYNFSHNIHFPASRKAYWYAKIGEAYLSSGLVQKATDNLLEALRLFGFTWPKSQITLNFTINKFILALQLNGGKNFQNTVHIVTPSCLDGYESNSKLPQKIANCIKLLQSLQHLFYMLRQEENVLLTSILLYRLLLSKGETMALAHQKAILGYSLWITEYADLGLALFRSAEKIISAFPGNHEDKIFITKVSGFYNFVKGNWAEARLQLEPYDDIIDPVSTFQWYNTDIIKFILNGLAWNLDEAIFICLRNFNYAIERNDFAVQSLAAFECTLIFIYKGAYGKAFEWGKRISEIYSHISVVSTNIVDAFRLGSFLVLFRWRILNDNTGAKEALSTCHDLMEANNFTSVYFTYPIIHSLVSSIGLFLEGAFSEEEKKKTLEFFRLILNMLRRLKRFCITSSLIYICKAIIKIFEEDRMLAVYYFSCAIQNPFFEQAKILKAISYAILNAIIGDELEMLTINRLIPEDFWFIEEKSLSDAMQKIFHKEPTDMIRSGQIVEFKMPQKITDYLHLDLFEALNHSVGDL